LMRRLAANRAGLDDSVLAHYLTEQLFNRLV
jgi:hypothetical protein